MRDEDLSRAIGDSIREHREALGLTLVELGDRLGMSQAMLSRIERGQRGLDSTMLRAVAEALEVPMMALFGRQVEGARVAASRDVVYARNPGNDQRATRPLVGWGRRILADLELVRQLQ